MKRVGLGWLILGTALISLSMTTAARAEDSASVPLRPDRPVTPDEAVPVVGSTHTHSPGMVAGGVTLLLAGAGITGAGVAILAVTACDETDLFCFADFGRALGATLIGAGLSHMVVGVVLGAVGARREPDRSPRSAVGLDVSVGPQGVYLLGTF